MMELAVSRKRTMISRTRLARMRRNKEAERKTSISIWRRKWDNCGIKSSEEVSNECFSVSSGVA